MTDTGALPFYDRDGRRITLDEWAALMEGDQADKRVAADDVVTPAGMLLWVSTVWVGIDNRLGGDGPPLIFETAVFERGGDDLAMTRWATWAEAVEGHRAFVYAAREGLLDTHREGAWPQD